MVQLKKFHDPQITENIWEHDYLDRQKFSEDLINLLKTINTHFVIALDAPYGAGKTFFLERLTKVLKDQNDYVVYFSAWETDGYSSPFIELMSLILEQFYVEKGIKDKIESEVIELGKTVLTAIFYGGLSALITHSTGLPVTVPPNIETKSKNLKTIDLVEINREEKKIINSFKESLAKAIKSTGKNIYIIIDELERCRPDVALDLLEKIKHIFNVPGLVFILGTHLDQLKSIVTKRYGNEIDSAKYLKRFFDIDISLPQTDKQRMIQKFCENYELNTIMAKGYDLYWGLDTLELFMKDCCQLFDITARDLSQVFIRLNKIIKTYEQKGGTPFLPLLTLLACLRQSDIFKYNQITQGNYDYPDLLDLLNEKFNFSSIDNETYKSIQIALLYGSIRSVESLSSIESKTRINNHSYYNERIFNQVLALIKRPNNEFDNNRNLPLVKTYREILERID